MLRYTPMPTQKPVVGSAGFLLFLSRFSLTLLRTRIDTDAQHHEFTPLCISNTIIITAKFSALTFRPFDV